MSRVPMVFNPGSSSMALVRRKAERALRVSTGVMRAIRKAFRAAWIDEARHQLNAGYTGLWVDDVNMFMQVRDGSGSFSGVART